MIISSKDLLEKFTSKREGETKLGEVITCNNANLTYSREISEKLTDFKGKYVILGISEDIGVRGNFGVKGARNGYHNFLSYFVNTQFNSFQSETNVMLLGEANVKELLETSDKTNDVSEWRKLCAEVDTIVFPIIQTIIENDKIPIIIGGGHNNSYPIIKGASLALSSKIDVLNIDPHCDFRKLEGRHSGNGFSYAYEEGFLNQYTVYGMQPYYNNKYMIDRFQKEDNLQYEILENCSLDVFQKVIDSYSDSFGLEIDMDTVIDFPTSAITSVGFSSTELRKMLQLANKKNLAYIHLTESAPKTGFEYRNGKLLSTLVCDIISTEKP